MGIADGSWEQWRAADLQRGDKAALFPGGELGIVYSFWPSGIRLRGVDEAILLSALVWVQRDPRTGGIKTLRPIT